ncbi:hypothetical protein ABEY48_06725 [Bacillus mycoides]|uniref:Uncharacterized protein n=1 Tax=Bacillus mycoides TaxID=1405 RepID=C2XS18_BACMY|nr:MULTISPECIES: hypothetical protein [Bacillus]EEL71470.1 hypothetical protein bcere0026_14830 [Bacillus mycoides]MBK5430784.1 hypothetical protein [Bacillus sp. TH25]
MFSKCIALVLNKNDKAPFYEGREYPSQCRSGEPYIVAVACFSTPIQI